MDDPEAKFHYKFDELINEQDSEGLVKFINENREYWNENQWIFIDLLLEDVTEFRNSDWSETCHKIITESCENGDPEEALLELVSNIEETKHHDTLDSSLRYIECVLPRLKYFHRSIEWILMALKRYIAKINVNGEETWGSIERPYNIALDFISKLETSDVVTCFRIQILGKPFSEWYSRNDPVTVSLAKRIFPDGVSNPISLIEDLHREKSKDSVADTPEEEFVTDLQKLPLEGLGMFCYFLFYEKIKDYPLVYDPVYLFQQGLYLVVELLGKDSVMEKGLLLSQTLIENLPQDLSYLLLDSTAHCEFTRRLTNYMIYFHSKDSRILAKTVFESYFLKFDTKGQYLLIRNIASENSAHSGLLEFLLSKYKNLFITQYPNVTKYFKGSHLRSIILTIGTIPERTQNNLMSYCDQILGILNFLVFIFMRDRDNLTEIWDNREWIDNRILEPLRSNIEKSKVEYYGLKKSLGKKSVGGGDQELNVTVNGEDLSHLPIEEQLKAINSSLNGFDLMNSLIIRVTECMKTQK